VGLPYESATSGERALQEIQKILLAFGCTAFGHMREVEKRELIVQFRYRERQVSIKASAKGYAAAWLKHYPWNSRMRRSRVEHEKLALQIGNVAVYSVIRDWIKGQVTAVETGTLSFEGAFLGQILLPSGQTVMEAVQAHKLLPAPA